MPPRVGILDTLATTPSSGIKRKQIGLIVGGPNGEQSSIWVVTVLVMFFVFEYLSGERQNSFEMSAKSATGLLRNIFFRA